MSRIPLRQCALALALLAAGYVADRGPMPSAEAMPFDADAPEDIQVEAIDAPGFRVLSHQAIASSNLTTDGSAQASSRLAARNGKQQDNELINEGFEGAGFPPPPWFLLDEKEVKRDDESVNAWSRQTCEVDDVNGGSAAAWVAGGGIEGSALNCGDNIGSDTSTVLVNNEIDTTAYPFGFEVDFRVWFDIPVGSQAFNICAGDAEFRSLSCQYIVIDLRLSQKTWLFLRNPIYFKDVGGQGAELTIYLLTY